MTVALISQGDLTDKIDPGGNPPFALPRYDEACRAVAELKAIDEVDGTLRVDVVREGEGGTAVAVLRVHVQSAVVVPMLVQQTGVQVRGGAVGVVVGDECRLRDDPAGEEARQDHHRQARSRPHRRVAASMALAHSTTLFTVRQADADVRRSTPGPGIVEEASMCGLVFRPSGPLW